MDDEKVAYPAYEYSRKVGIKNICVHKGLPLPELGRWSTAARATCRRRRPISPT